MDESIEQKQLGVRDLHGRRDTSRSPVVHPLHTPAFEVVAEPGRHLRWAAERVDDLSVNVDDFGVHLLI